jgi:hypothetical protein
MRYEWLRGQETRRISASSVAHVRSTKHGSRFARGAKSQFAMQARSALKRSLLPRAAWSPALSGLNRSWVPAGAGVEGDKRPRGGVAGAQLALAALPAKWHRSGGSQGRKARPAKQVDGLSRGAKIAVGRLGWRRDAKGPDHPRAQQLAISSCDAIYPPSLPVESRSDTEPSLGTSRSRRKSRRARGTAWPRRTWVAARPWWSGGPWQSLAAWGAWVTPRSGRCLGGRGDVGLGHQGADSKHEGHNCSAKRPGGQRQEEQSGMSPLVKVFEALALELDGFPGLKLKEADQILFVIAVFGRPKADEQENKCHESGTCAYTKNDLRDYIELDVDLRCGRGNQADGNYSRAEQGCLTGL